MLFWWFKQNELKKKKKIPIPKSFSDRLIETLKFHRRCLRRFTTLAFPNFLIACIPPKMQHSIQNCPEMQNFAFFFLNSISETESRFISMQTKHNQNSKCSKIHPDAWPFDNNQWSNEHFNSAFILPKFPKRIFLKAVSHFSIGQLNRCTTISLIH